MTKIARSKGGSEFHNLAILLKKKCCEYEVLLKVIRSLFLAVDLVLR